MHLLELYVLISSLTTQPVNQFLQRFSLLFIGKELVHLGRIAFFIGRYFVGNVLVWAEQLCFNVGSDFLD